MTTDDVSSLFWDARTHPRLITAAYDGRTEVLQDLWRFTADVSPATDEGVCRWGLRP